MIVLVRVAAMLLRGAGGGPLGPAEVDPDATRDVACGLTATEVRCSPPAPDPTDFDPPDLGGGGAGFGPIGTLLVVLLVAALVAVVVWMVAKAIKEREMDDDDDPIDLDEDLDEGVADRITDEQRPPDRWRRAAEEHRAAGRFRDAVRCDYRALVGDLARAGAVDEIPGRTSGEERAQLAALAPKISHNFDEAADIFDEAWFNNGEVTADDDTRFFAASRGVLDIILARTGPRRDRRAP
ncbi:MAG: hypothetical protein ACI9N0_003548 [Ilumatobacter sp.]|jgi:hypothetical protein